MALCESLPHSNVAYFSINKTLTFLSQQIVQVYIVPVALRVPGRGDVTWQAFDKDDEVYSDIQIYTNIFASVLVIHYRTV